MLFAVIKNNFLSNSKIKIKENFIPKKKNHLHHKKLLILNLKG